MMASINNSPWYYEILADGIELGRRLSIEYGFKKGFENDHQIAEGLKRVLYQRFGPLPSSLVGELALLSREQTLGLLSDAMDTDTLAEFRASLPQNEWHPQGAEW
ncbi:MAG: hypothetical protein IAE85_07625 [Anaerolinea sp.]|nr:hypothetical protein [Anaerolinea sp.]